MPWRARTPERRACPVPPAQSFRATAALPPGRLHIAWSAQPASGAKPDADCVAAVQAAAVLLQRPGHDVREDAPPLEWEAFLENIHVIWTVFTVSFADALAKATGRKPGPDTLEAATLACYEDGKRFSAMDLVRAMDYGNLVSRRVGAFFEGRGHYGDADDRPATSAARRDRSGPCRHRRHRMDPSGFRLLPLHALYNTTGQPAISLPLGRTASGLPVGVQFAARLGEEATLLQTRGTDRGCATMVGISAADPHFANRG